MIVKRFYDEKLAQASYLIGCAATGEALVLDANRDVEPYLEAARNEGLSVTHISETHIHADYVSGSRELAERTGGRLHLSDEGGPDWKYAFAAEYDAVLLKDGDRFMVGNVQIDVLHTPGHTPEHLSFLVTDTAAADRPIAAVTGDFVFVGDVGRPDLLEKAAHVVGTMEASARDLFRSLQAFKEQPDYLQIWPGHGAGSACGKGLSSIPHSTVGYERMFNWAFAIEDEDAFVSAVLEGQPEPPRYFAEMKRINKEGPRVLGAITRPRRLQGSRLPELLQADGLVVDARSAADFSRAHVPGTLNIPLDRAFTTWAGWLIPYDHDFHLLVDDHHGDAVAEAVRDLAMIGLDRVGGTFGSDAVDAWGEAGGKLQGVPRTSVDELAGHLEAGSVTLLDVRGLTEWEAGHLPGVEPTAGEHGIHIPLGDLRERLDELPRGQPVVAYCHAGGRSAIAASVLQAHGFTQVSNLEGGFQAWRESRRPVEKGTAASTSAPAHSSQP